MRELTEFQKGITDYIFIKDEPKPSDVIFLPGNGYPQMAEYAAALWKQGMAPYILPSGKYSITQGHFGGVKDKKETYCEDYETEWEFLQKVLLKNGVDSQAILREDQATFTYENAIYSRKVTDRLGISVTTAMICCRSTHARRCKMYYQEQFPQAQLLICPSDIGGITGENWYETSQGIEMVTGEIGRIFTQFVLYKKNPPGGGKLESLGQILP